MSEFNRNAPTPPGPDSGAEGEYPASGTILAVDFAPGSTVAGKYRIDRLIGEGGLGSVVKARHLQLEQDFAIKYIRPTELSRPGVVERFLREGRLAAKIKNEHAVKVQDVDTLESGAPYLVMEFLEGKDLGQILLDDGPLPIARAIDYVLQACEALAEAHSVGIVHRDLKPTNMFLAQRPGGVSLVKVLDFGISRLAGERAARVTLVDERIGTPQYMSPEQLNAATDVDARADVWAIGVSLYELVTGQVPFPGEDLAQLCVNILTKPPVPMSAIHPDATPELEAVVLRCLEKDREKRYQNIAEVAQDLATFWEQEVEPPSRVQQIARVMRDAGVHISPPTPLPGSIDLAQVQAVLAGKAAAKPATSLAESRTIEANVPGWTEATDHPVEDHVVAVLRDTSGAAVDELEFLSIDEAYEYACSQSSGVVCCEIYDQLAGIRGRLRVTYVKNAETGHWVPQLA